MKEQYLPGVTEILHIYLSYIQLQENGTVTTVGINVTLAPMEAMQTEDGARDSEPPDLPEKENSFAITNSNNLMSGSSLTSEQLTHLKQCRNRAYSIVNK